MTTDEVSTDYLNFDLALEAEAGGYLASVRASPVGEASAEFVLPFTPEGLENVVLKLGHTRAVVRGGGSSQTALARRFGTSLYEAVFSGEVEFIYRRSLEEAERRGVGLRLRLNLDQAPELVDVPWELLYSPALHRPLVLSTKTPLARYMGLPFPARPLTVDGPLKVLVVVAGPTDLVTLDSDEELDRIREATADLQRAGFVELDLLGNATLGDLVRRLGRSPCHVLHFVGHGGYEEHDGVGGGVLAFEDANRLHHLVSGDDIGVLLHDHRTLRLAVLNACEGGRTSPTDPFAGVAQSLIRQGIPAVIAMQFEVTDTAATTFSHELYRALVDGRPVDEATGIARKAVFAANTDVEWATPVLYMRSASGHIFDVPDVDTTALLPPVPLDVERDEHVPDDHPADAGAEDAGPEDAGPEDAGPEDAGPADAGAVGGGPPTDPDVEPAGETEQPPADERPIAPDPTGDGSDANLPEVERRALRRGPVGAGLLAAAAAVAAFVWWLPGTADDTDDAQAEETDDDGSDDGGDDGTDDGTGTGADTDFAATFVAQPQSGGAATWADGLARIPTPHPAEGEADPRVTSQWTLGWNEDALHLFVEVEDPEISTPHVEEPWRMFQGDGINFNFGADPTDMEEQDLLRDDDIQVMIGPRSSDAEAAVSGIQTSDGDGQTCVDGRFFGRGQATPQIDATAQPTPDGYSLQAEVPWSVLGQLPEAGAVYGIILTVADAEGPTPGSGRRGSRSSTPDRGSTKHCPARWQTLELLAP